MRALTGASLSVVAMLALGSVATPARCAKVGKVEAMRYLKEANKAYQAQDYKKASQLYSEAISQAPNDPDVVSAYFFLGNSYDNQWKPSKKGDAENDALLQKAVENYQLAAEKLSTSDKPDYKHLGTLALQYLVAAYGNDKLNDPAKAEPVLQKMIQQDPGDPAVYMTLAGYYNRQGAFDKTIDALRERAAKEPNNPEAFYTISTFYWDKAFRDTRLKENEKKDFVNKGIEAIDHALQIKPDYAEALVYKGLLLRLQANLEKDVSKQQALLKEADRLRDKAQELRKQKAAGVGD